MLINMTWRPRVPQLTCFPATREFQPTHHHGVFAQRGFCNKRETINCCVAHHAHKPLDRRPVHQKTSVSSACRVETTTRTSKTTITTTPTTMRTTTTTTKKINTNTRTRTFEAGCIWRYESIAAQRYFDCLIGHQIVYSFLPLTSKFIFLTIQKSYLFLSRSQRCFSKVSQVKIFLRKEFSNRNNNLF